MLPMEGIEGGGKGKEDEEEGKDSSVDTLARRDAAFRLPAPSGELAPLGAPLNDRSGALSAAALRALAPAPPAFSAPALPPGGPVIDVVPRPSPRGKAPSSSRPPSAPSAASSLPGSPSANDAAGAAATAADADSASAAPTVPRPPPQQQPSFLLLPPQPSAASFPRNRGVARRERAAAADPDFYLLAGVVFSAPAAVEAATAAAAAAAAAETEARVLSGERPDVSRLPESPVRAFVLSACAFEPSERPSAAGLLLHPWIAGGGSGSGQSGQRPGGPGAKGAKAAAAAAAASPLGLLQHAPSCSPTSWKIGAGTAAAAAAAAVAATAGGGAGAGENAGGGDLGGVNELERAETVLPRGMSM